MKDLQLYYNEQEYTLIHNGETIFFTAWDDLENYLTDVLELEESEIKTLCNNAIES